MKDTITINDFFEIAKKIDLNDLLDKSLHESDPAKRKPQYIIVAGINGAGKSTLYDTFPILFDKTIRINADEILRQMGGDWYKDSDNLKAMREEINQLHYSLDNRQSIHVETTLAERGKTQLNLIDKAHENGFEVTLLYVALRDENLAIKRVEDRVQKG